MSTEAPITFSQDAIQAKAVTAMFENYSDAGVGASDVGLGEFEPEIPSDIPAEVSISVRFEYLP